MVFTIEDILYQWEYLGVYDFILPFLLIFAIIYGITSSTKFMGDNKGVYVVISVAIALIAVRYTHTVSDFMEEIFPRLGIGIVVILTILILVGMFIAQDETRYWGWGLAGLAGIIGLIVIYQSFDAVYWLGGYGLGIDSAELIAWLILGILIVITIVAVVSSKSTRRAEGKAVFLPAVGGWGK